MNLSNRMIDKLDIDDLNGKELDSTIIEPSVASLKTAKAIPPLSLKACSAKVVPPTHLRISHTRTSISNNGGTAEIEGKGTLSSSGKGVVMEMPQLVMKLMEVLEMEVVSHLVCR